MSAIPMRYTSTRSDSAPVLFSEALLKGLAPDGGLYVPVSLPPLDLGSEFWLNKSYQERCYNVLKPFMPEIDGNGLMAAIVNAYDQKFDSQKIAPVVDLSENVYVLELFRGKTQAFKDMALSLLPHLMALAAKITETEQLQRIVLTATSGDTGKAALEAFAHIPGVQVVVFYPTDGVSPMQKQQMATQLGDNVHVFAIEGNFDDAQKAVKSLMNDNQLAERMIAKGMCFASANSVNIGRLLPQIVYYVNAYYDMVTSGDITLGQQINVVVPTGNFGNLLSAYYAKQMGLPVGQLILAANDNRVLHDFVVSGTYNANRPFHVTSAPSMDILVSSNLERLLFAQSGGDWSSVKGVMQALSDSGQFNWLLPEGLLYSGSASNKETNDQILKTYQKSGYVLDPHTAVGLHVLEAYRLQTGDHKTAIVAGTASPYKFPTTVLEALGYSQMDNKKEDSTDASSIDAGSTEASLRALSKIWGEDIPTPLLEALQLPVKHEKVLKKEQMKWAVEALLEGGSL